MDVELPDGTVVEGVPDGMSRADLVVRLQRNGYDVSKLGPAPKQPTFGEMFKAEAMTSLPGGIVRGVKDVIDTGAEYLSKLGGNSAQVQAGNDAGKADFKAAQDLVGAGGSDVSRFGGNVIGTGPVGPVLATAAKTLKAAPAVVSALRTSGMNAGGATGAAGIGARVLGGGATGAASAGLVNPGDEVTGGVIGAALPPALKIAGPLGTKVGGLFRGPEQAPEIAAAIAAARQSGYVIPPTQAKPTLSNRLMEGFAGKISTAQNASARNQGVTNRKAAEALGLPPDAPITAETLKNVREQAGKAYEAVASAGTMKMQPGYDAALDKIVDPYLLAAKGFPGAKVSPIVDEIEALRTPIADAASVVAKVGELRKKADAAFASGDKAMGKALRGGADALEEAIETHLGMTGAPVDLLANFRTARTLIAKTYSVEKALNQTTGTVDAKKLAGQLARGKPLSGGLKEAGEFAARFPKAAQTPEVMGSLPGTSPLDWAAAGSVGMATGNPLALAGVLGRPMARSLALSPRVQNSLIQTPGISGGLLGLHYRVAPLLGNDQ